MVFVVIDKTGRLPSFRPMNVGFNVFGSHQFEKIIKFIELNRQVAVVGGKISGVPDNETFTACRSCFRIVAAKLTGSLYAVCPRLSQISGKPLR